MNNFVSNHRSIYPKLTSSRIYLLLDIQALMTTNKMNLRFIYERKKEKRGERWMERTAFSDYE